MLARSLAIALAGLLALIPGVPSEARGYQLGVGDTLRIKVAEWPELSGEFAVAPDGTIFMAPIGQVMAEGLTPPELAGEIAGRVRAVNALDAGPGTSVEIVSFRPVFIVGDVQNPGEYAYRPGMTVLHALSIAGGMHRPRDGDDARLEREAISTRGQLRLLGLKTDQFTARKARLDAELTGMDTVMFPASLLDRRGEPSVDLLLMEERLLFEAHAREFSEQKATFIRLVELLHEEIGSLEGEIEMVQVQLDAANEELASVRSLVARGLTPAPRQLSLERLVANIAGQQRGLDTAILRARQGIATGEQRIRDLSSERMKRILRDGQQAQADLEHAFQQLETTRQLLMEVEAAGATMAQDRGQRATIISYRLIRGADGEQQRIDAGELTPVEPGDIVEVERIVDPVIDAGLTMPGTSGDFAGALGATGSSLGN